MMEIVSLPGKFLSCIKIEDITKAYLDKNTALAIIIVRGIYNVSDTISWLCSS